MKTKYILAPAVLSAMAFVGCVDLDTAPEGSTVTSEQKGDVATANPEMAAAGVTAIFAQFTQAFPNSNALGAERHNDIGYPTVMLCTDSNGSDCVSENNGYNWCGYDLDFSDRDYTGNEAQMIWNDMYAIIYASNNVIANIDPATTDAQSQYYLAQGLAARAFSYFTLAQLYQFNYAVIDPSTALCVPLITNENADDAALNGAPRATVQVVYDQINSDIDMAIELLTSAQSAGQTRTDKRYIDLATAYGIRARVNLTMRNYAKAAADATSAISYSSASPSLIAEASKPAFWSANEKDWMWGIIIAETDDVVTTAICNWISHMGSFNYGYANYSLGRQISKKLYNTISATDARKGWWLDENSMSANLTDAQQAMITAYAYGPYTQVKFAPYNNVLETATNANDIPLMRIEEMYLIKAEGEAMSGGDGLSTLVNFVQTYRDASYAFSSANAENIQEEIFRQRRIELWGEGLNWYDIMRLNKGVDRRGAGFPNANMIFNIEAGDKVLLWRIPEAEIQANPALNEEDNNEAQPDPVAVPDVE